MTDFGENGNFALASTFGEYVKANRHRESSRGQAEPRDKTASQDQNPRLMITGFGLFNDITFNPTGCLVESLADSDFWPTDGNLAGYPRRFALPGTLSEEDHGARVFTRQIRVNASLGATKETFVNLCLIIFDVKWDLAGAILVHEMRKFQPDLVIMTGRGQSDFVMESGAINRTTQAPGFDSSGKRLPELNQPESEWILERSKSGSPTTNDNPMTTNDEIAMTWENQRLGPLFEKQIEQLGYPLRIPSQARTDNNYICNNLSFIGAHAAQGNEISLAGGLIRFEAEEIKPPQIGFLHMPTIDTQFKTPESATSTIFGLAQFVMSFAARNMGI